MRPRELNKRGLLHCPNHTVPLLFRLDALGRRRLRSHAPPPPLQLFLGLRQHRRFEAAVIACCLLIAAHASIATHARVVATQTRTTRNHPQQRRSTRTRRPWAPDRLVDGLDVPAAAEQRSVAAVSRAQARSGTGSAALACSSAPPRWPRPLARASLPLRRPRRAGRAWCCSRTQTARGLCGAAGRRCGLGRLSR